MDDAAALRASYGRERLMADEFRHYPIAIIEDRYNGVYSGGAWLAISRANEIDGRWKPRVVDILEDGPHGDDTDAQMFWDNPPDWIAIGHTPDEALKALKSKRKKAAALSDGREDER